MSSKRISRNQPCPCGSGKKYKQCCYRKGFTYEEDSSGTIRRSVRMNDELGMALSGHLDSLGDDLDPESPVFPNMNLETAEFEMVRAMEESGIDPAIVYAFTETGMLISEENMHLFSQIDMDLLAIQD